MIYTDGTPTVSSSGVKAPELPFHVKRELERRQGEQRAEAFVAGVKAAMHGTGCPAGADAARGYARMLARIAEARA